MKQGPRTSPRCGTPIASQWLGTGFTLIELLAVIAVVALLAGLLLPVIASARQRSRTAACRSNLHQVGIGLQIYVQECGAYPLASVGDGLGNWQRALRPLAGTAAFHCPQTVRAADKYVRMFQFSSSLIHPHYGYNYLGTTQKNPPPVNLGLGGDYSWDDLGATHRPTPESRVAAPSRMIALGDSDAAIFVPLQSQPTPDYADLLHVTFPHVVSGPEFAGVGRWHARGALMLFCDGHVEFERQERWTQPLADRRSLWNNDGKPHLE